MKKIYNYQEVTTGYRSNEIELAKTVYSQLFGDEVERTELWNSLEKSGESELKLEDEEGNDLASAAAIM